MKVSLRDVLGAVAYEYQIAKFEVTRISVNAAFRQTGYIASAYDRALQQIPPVWALASEELREAARREC